MNDTPQLASALFAIAFAVVMVVGGRQFIEYKSKKMPPPTANVIAVVSPEKLPAR